MRSEKQQYVVFVGGPMDGRRMAVDRNFTNCLKPLAPVPPGPPGAVDEMTVETFTYRRVPFHGIDFMVPEEQHRSDPYLADWLLEKLAEGYVGNIRPRW